MIHISNLGAGYGGQPVLQNLWLQLAAGQAHGIAGLNGSGKTTFFKVLAGLLKPSAGKVLLNGQALNRQQVAFLETENFFYSNITGAEYLSVFPGEGFRLQEWNQLFMLPLNELAENYSTGMKKKLALMAMLKLDRPVLVLDEPFNGIDMETAWLLKNLLGRLRDKGHTLLVSSHIIETLEGLCDTLHYIENGQIAFSSTGGNVQQLKEQIFGKASTTINQALDNLLGGTPL